MSTPTLNPLVSKIRAKYPGAYDDMDDASLTKAILAKYPQYEDLAAPATAMTQQPGQSIGNIPRPANPIDKAPVASPVAGMPGAAPYTPAAPDAALPIAAGAIGAAGLGVYGPALLPYAKAAAKTIPYIAASEAINYARQKLPGGKYIPQSDELIPLIMSGGQKEEPVKPPSEPPPARPVKPEPLAPASTDQVPGRPYMPNPRYTPPPEPAAPIPPRSGLQLTGQVDTPVAPVSTGNLPKPSTNPYAGARVPQTMELVDSTNVSKVGYHSDSQTMMVEYRNGRVYEYRGVPKEIYQQAKDAESVGSFIARNVKGRYQTNYRGSVLGKKP